IYRRHYKVELIDQLESEMSGTDLKEATAALSGNQVDAAVASLQNALDGVGTDNEKIQAVLERVEDPEERRTVIDEFEGQTGRTLTTVLDERSVGTQNQVNHALLASDNKERHAEAGAIRLGAAVYPNGEPNGDEIVRVLENCKDPDERNAIIAAYEKSGQ